MHRPRPAADQKLPWLAWSLLLLALPIAGQEVTLPLERYDQLRAHARPAPAPESEPPAPVAFESAAVKVTIRGAAASSTARITQDLTLTILDPAWQNIPLGDAGTLIEADFGTAEGRLDGAVLVLRGLGQHHVRLTSVAPLILDETATRPILKLRLGMPRAAVVHGSVETPSGIEEVEADGALVMAGDHDSRWDFVADPGAEVRLALRGAALTPEKDTLPLRFEVISGLALEVVRGRRRARAWLEAQVRQGRLERLTAPIPEGFDVINITGDAIAGWDVAEGRLEITPLAPITDRLSLELELAADAATELSSPTLVPDGATAVLAATKVQVSGDGLLHLMDAGSGRQPDGRQQVELPAGFTSAPGMALVQPADGRPARWRVIWADGMEVLAAQVDRLLVDVLIGASGHAGYQLWAEVRNRGAEQLTFELPIGAELIDARREGRQIKPGLSVAQEGRQSSGPRAWMVPLSASDDRQVIYLSSLLPLELPAAGGRLDVPLPAFSAPVGRVEIGVTLPAGRRYELIDSVRRGSIGEPPIPRLPIPQKRVVDFGMVATMAAVEPAPALFPLPPGSGRVAAAWSALSPAPSPLGIRIKDDSDSRRWF